MKTGKNRNREIENKEKITEKQNRIKIQKQWKSGTF